MADMDIGPYLLDKTLGKGTMGSVTKDGTTYSRGMPTEMPASQRNDAHLRSPEDTAGASSISNAVKHLNGLGE